MIAKYNQLKQSYKESSKKHDEVDLDVHLSERSDAEKSGKVVNKIMPSPHDKASFVDVVEQNATQFLIELKTSQLKAIQEKRLIQSFEKIRKMYIDSIAILQKSLDDAKQTNGSYIEKVEILSNEIHEQKEKAAQVQEELKAEQNRLKSEFIACNKELEQSRLKNTQLIKKQKSDMDFFLSKMEEEVEIVQLAMKEKSTEKMKHWKSVLVQDKDRELQLLRSDISKLKEENTQFRNRLKEKDEVHQKNMDALNVIVANKARELDEIQQSLEVSTEKTKDSNKKLDDLQHLMVHEKKHWSERLEKQKEERQQELNIIEHKVSNIIRTKDFKIKSMYERAVKSESRVKELEKLFECIEMGFVQEGNQECKT